MRNMKRALSLVLAMVMLLGMFMIPTGAAGTFTDADLIENTEAVQITSGIGLFAGTTEGEFAPKGTVTRAQMATIIVKMLRGSDFNADAFKGVGVNPFPDTADFEGGWAEGYINACVQMGVVAGYGDGTFKPDKAVTTAEAMTMIINALGVDPGPGEWPLTYMAKAESMKLYGDLETKPGTNSALNRDQLAVIVWEGLQYSPAGKSGYKIPGSDLVFTEVTDAILANGNSFEGITEAVGQDSLASKVYEIKVSTGWITGNQAAGQECTVLTLADGSEEDYGVETGVDMLGHYVTVYYKEQYKNDEEPGEVYTVVDESTVVTVKEAIDTAKEYKAAFGKNINEAQNGLLLGDDYTVTEQLSNDMDIDGYTAGSAAPKGTYIIADGVIVAYIAPIATFATIVSDISSERIWLNTDTVPLVLPNNEGDDRVVEYDGVAVGDFVTYVVVRDQYVLSPVTKVTGAITRTSTTELNGENYDTITLMGKDYLAFGGTSFIGRELDTSLSDVQYGQNYDLYITKEGRYIGFESDSGAVSLENTVYILGAVQIKEKDQYGKEVIYNKARGVDMEGQEVMILLGLNNGTEILGSMDSVSETFYTVADSTDRDEKKEGIQTLTAYPTSYSANNPTYVTQNKTGSSTTTGFTGAATTGMGGIDGIDCWGKSGIKIILLDASTLEQSEPIEATVYTNTISPGLKEDKLYELLVTRDKYGVSNTVNVLVYNNSEPFGSGTNIYVTQDQLDSASDSLEGREYMAYAASTGTEEKYILQDGTDLDQGPGFYTGKPDKDGLYNFTKVKANVGDKNSSGGILRVNQAFKGVISGGRLYTPDITWHNTGADYAKVIDARTEAEIIRSEVPEITSVNQLNALRENNPDTIVMVDVHLTRSGSSNHPKVDSIYVAKVVRNTIGLGTVAYAFKTPVSGDTMISVSGGTKETGDKLFNVAFDTCVGQGAGFYRLDLDAAGKLVLTKVGPSTKSAGYYNVFGLHNVIEEINETTGLVETKDHSAQSDCGDCVNANEALSSFYITEQTRIFKADGSEIENLEELVQYNDESELVINYYCADGAKTATSSDADKDNTAEMVVIWGETKRPESICNGNHSEHTPLTNADAAIAKTWSIDITAPGKYVLSEDITSGQLAFSMPASTDEVILCLNGHSITSTDADSPLYLAKGTFTLCNCNSKEGGILSGGTSRGMIVGGGSSSIANVTVDHNVHFDGATLNGNLAAPIFVNKDSSLTMNGGTISDNTATANVANAFVAGAIRNNGGNVTLNGVTISGNSATSTNTTSGNAGAIVVSSGDLTINSGAVIQKNTTKSAVNGGTVCFGGTGKLTVAGGTIIGNEAASGTNGANIAGAILLTGAGQVAELSNVTISGSETTLTGATSAGSAGAIVLTAGTKMDIKNGTLITGNTTASSWNGGTICIFNNCVLNMEDGTISKNNAANGGGVTLVGGTFNMSGGSITENEVTSNGGGVFSWGTFNLSGGTISGNTAKANGDGVRVQSTKFNMTGGSIVAEGDAVNVNSGKTAVISGGSVDGTLVNSGTLTITGGTFGADPKQFVDEATHTVTVEGGKYVVKPQQ